MRWLCSSWGIRKRKVAANCFRQLSFHTGNYLVFGKCNGHLDQSMQGNPISIFSDRFLSKFRQFAIGKRRCSGSSKI
jgi:hypothetical protein